MIARQPSTVSVAAVYDRRLIRCVWHRQMSFVENNHPKSTPRSVCERLIRVENSFVPTCHRPKIRPENKGIKPLHKLPQGDSSQKSPCKLSQYPPHESYLAHPFLATLLKERCDAVTFLKPIQGYSSQFTPIQAFLAPPGGPIIFFRLACRAEASRRRVAICGSRFWSFCLFCQKPLFCGSVAKKSQYDNPGLFQSYSQPAYCPKNR